MRFATLRVCLFDNWESSFLPHLTFYWHTCLRRVIASWSRGEQKVKCQPIRMREIAGVKLKDELNGIEVICDYLMMKCQFPLVYLSI